LFLEKLTQAYQLNQLQFFAQQQTIKEEKPFMDWIKSLSQIEWVVYAKRPFADPAAVLAYLSRYTHRIAIANSRLLSMNEKGVTFRWKDYRLKGAKRNTSMTLTADEFIRRFLIHVLPSGFHRLRHYGLIANANRKNNLIRARTLLQVKEAELPVHEVTTEKQPSEEQAATYICPDCGTPMIIIETFARQQQPRAPPVKQRKT
ncbi:MAG: transposase, partial [Amphritea sp.]|nr:transposase [Amphritea sp.]